MRPAKKPGDCCREGHFAWVRRVLLTVPNRVDILCPRGRLSVSHFGFPVSCGATITTLPPLTPATAAVFFFVALSKPEVRRRMLGNNYDSLT